MDLDSVTDLEPLIIPDKSGGQHARKPYVTPHWVEYHYYPKRTFELNVCRTIVRSSLSGAVEAIDPVH